MVTYQLLLRTVSWAIFTVSIFYIHFDEFLIEEYEKPAKLYLKRST